MKKMLIVVAVGLLLQGCQTMSPAQKAAMEFSKSGHPRVISVEGEDLISIPDWRIEGEAFHVSHHLYRLKDGKLQFIPMKDSTPRKPQKLGSVTGVGKNDKEAWHDASEKMRIAGYKDCRLVEAGSRSNVKGTTKVEFHIYANQ